MQFVNLTGKTIEVTDTFVLEVGRGGQVEQIHHINKHVYYASSLVASVHKEVRSNPDVDQITITDFLINGTIINLPDPIDNIGFIVSDEVLQALRGSRSDVYAPDINSQDVVLKKV